MFFPSHWCLFISENWQSLVWKFFSSQARMAPSQKCNHSAFRYIYSLSFCGQKIYSALKYLRKIGRPHWMLETGDKLKNCEYSISFFALTRHAPKFMLYLEWTRHFKTRKRFIWFSDEKRQIAFGFFYEESICHFDETKDFEKMVIQACVLVRSFLYSTWIDWSLEENLKSRSTPRYSKIEIAF